MTLEDVGPDNWRHCAALEVEESQRPFVAPVPVQALGAAQEPEKLVASVRVVDGGADLVGELVVGAGGRGAGQRVRAGLGLGEGDNVTDEGAAAPAPPAYRSCR
jgi:hypothetical protein